MSYYLQAEVEPTGRVERHGWLRRRHVAEYTVLLIPGPGPSDRPPPMPLRTRVWCETDLAAEGRALHVLADANAAEAMRAALRARRRVIRGAG